MKQASDILQYILQSGFIPALLLIFAALVLFFTPMLRLSGRVVMLARYAARWIMSLFWPVVWAVVVPLAIICATFRGAIHSGLQYLENWASPVYLVQDDARALAIYEAELSKYCDPYELQVVKSRTAEMAGKLGCGPLSIYEVAFAECGLNPFVIRRDGIAAGWIQFTNAGLVGLGVSLPEVKEMCHKRNIVSLMNLTEKYFVSRCNGRVVKNATDAYVVVFAPAFLGRPDETVLYDRGEAYTKNSGLDGYYISGDRIAFNDAEKDGKITINDLRLCLAYKRAMLVKKYQK